MKANEVLNILHISRGTLCNYVKNEKIITKKLIMVDTSMIQIQYIN